MDLAQQLLERGELDNYTKKYVLLIKNNAERMQQLLNELMEFRKADKGYTILHAETINLKSMLNSIIDNFMLLAGENHIQLSVRIEAIDSFNTDRNVLEKIFFNLISNAFKYTPKPMDISKFIWNVRLTALFNFESATLEKDLLKSSVPMLLTDSRFLNIRIRNMP